VIVVRVELHSAVTGKVSELARMYIVNNGTDRRTTHGSYWCRTVKGRSTAALNKLHVQRAGFTDNYPRTRLHVWNLVARCLRVMEYK
jgi:hypothetical protein